VDRDLYILVLAFNDLTFAHGQNSKLLGKDTSGLKDSEVNSSSRNRSIMRKQNEQDGYYNRSNPMSKKNGARAVYVQRQDSGPTNREW